MEEGTTAREKAETERGKIFRIDERLLEDHLGRVVRSSVEETLIGFRFSPDHS